MSELVLLPDWIPGLLRRGSPVVSPGGHRRGTVTHVSERGWVVIEDEPHVFGDEEWDGRTPGSSAGNGELRMTGWQIDLTEVTGRAHAAWWLAERSGLPLSAGALWTVIPLARTGMWALSTHLRGSVVRFRAEAAADPIQRQRHEDVVVASLSDLDPADPRLLPDGSRWVDAEALRRVVLQVAGVKS